jgi:hypothetical protein
MTGDTGAAAWGVKVSELRRKTDGSGTAARGSAGGAAAGSSTDSPGMVALRRSLSFAFAARKSVL